MGRGGKGKAEKTINREKNISVQLTPHSTSRSRDLRFHEICAGQVPIT